MTRAFDKISAGLEDAIAFAQGDLTRGRRTLVNPTPPTVISGLTSEDITKLIYGTNPASIIEIEEQDDRTPRADEPREVYGESMMSWDQAVSDRPQEYLDAVRKTDELIASRVPEAELVNFIGVEGLLGEMGNFTWFYGHEWFVETKFGNFIWSDPDYVDGDNSFTFFEGGIKEFSNRTNVGVGKSKGRNLILNKCGRDIVLNIPALEE